MNDEVVRAEEQKFYKSPPAAFDPIHPLLTSTSISNLVLKLTHFIFSNISTSCSRLKLKGMKTKGRSTVGGVRWSLGLPTVCLFCFFFFVAGLFASMFLSHQELSPGLRPKPRLLESIVKEENQFNPLPRGETGQDTLTQIPFQVLSWKPRALYFPGFAEPEHCETIIKIAKARLAPSSLALRKGETAESTKGTRTSSGTFMSASEDKTGTLDIIEGKIARATMIPRTHGEAFNILRYEIGQKYNSHYDAFHPAEYGPQKSQRIASFLLYLSDVEEGGETMFPFENGLNVDNYDFEKCIGLKVKPRKGDGLLFYSVLPNGTIDMTSLHGSCPVVTGQKWVATKWIRDQEQDD